MTPADDPSIPDVDRLARSMLLLHGAHDDHEHAHRGGSSGSSAGPMTFADDPQRAAAIREATRRDRDRYLTAGLHPVDCRFCHVTVAVKRLGPGHTAVQWNADAAGRCAHFAEVRASGGDTSRIRACPRLTDSIEHAVAEGYL